MSTVVVFLLVMALVAAYLVYRTPGSLVVKTVLLVLMFYSASAIYYSFESYRGWPTAHRSEKDVVLLSVIIFEKTNTTPGFIYATGVPCALEPDECLRYAPDDSLWARVSPLKVFGYVPSHTLTPRLYEFEYTEENREKFDRARQNIKNGGRSVLEGTEGEGEGEGQSGDKKAVAGEGDVGPDGQETSKDPNAPEITNVGPEDLLRK